MLRVWWCVSERVHVRGGEGGLIDLLCLASPCPDSGSGRRWRQLRDTNRQCNRGRSIACTFSWCAGTNTLLHLYALTMQVIRQLREHGRVIRPYVGIKMLQVRVSSDGMANDSGMPGAGGPGHGPMAPPQLSPPALTLPPPLRVQLNRHNAAQFRKRDPSFPDVSGGLGCSAAPKLHESGAAEAGALPSPLPSLNLRFSSAINLCRRHPGASSAPRLARGACWPTAWGRHRGLRGSSLRRHHRRPHQGAGRACGAAHGAARAAARQRGRDAKNHGN